MVLPWSFFLTLLYLQFLGTLLSEYVGIDPFPRYSFQGQINVVENVI